MGHEFEIGCSVKHLISGEVGLVVDYSSSMDEYVVAYGFGKHCNCTPGELTLHERAAVVDQRRKV